MTRNSDGFPGDDSGAFARAKEDGFQLLVERSESQMELLWAERQRILDPGRPACGLESVQDLLDVGGTRHHADLPNNAVIEPEFTGLGMPTRDFGVPRNRLFLTDLPQQPVRRRLIQESEFPGDLDDCSFERNASKFGRMPSTKTAGVPVERGF